MKKIYKEHEFEAREIVRGDHTERRFVVYDKAGKEILLGQLLDAVNAVYSGNYTTKPLAQVKAVEAKAPAKRARLSKLKGK